MKSQALAPWLIFDGGTCSPLESVAPKYACSNQNTNLNAAAALTLAVVKNVCGVKRSVAYMGEEIGDSGHGTRAEIYVAFWALLVH